MPLVPPNPTPNLVTQEVAVGAPVASDWGLRVAGAINYLLEAPATVAALSSGTPTILNGSFELDLPPTIQPTGWVWSNHTSGQLPGNVISTDQFHGTNSYMVPIQTGANAGGTLAIATGTFPTGLLQCSEGLSYAIEFAIKATSTPINLPMSLIVSFYDSSGTLMGSPTSFELSPAVTPPPSPPPPPQELGTAWSYVRKTFAPPSGARYFTVMFDVGGPSSNVPSLNSVLIDGIFLFFPQKYARMFSNYNGGSSQVISTFQVPPGVTNIKARLAGGSNAVNSASDFKRGYLEGWMTDLRPGDLIYYGVGDTSGEETYLKVDSTGNKYKWSAAGSLGSSFTSAGGEFWDTIPDRALNPIVGPRDQGGMIIFEW